MNLFPYKYKVTKDIDGYYNIYRKRFIFWTLIACAISHERAKKKIEDATFCEYF